MKQEGRSFADTEGITWTGEPTEVGIVCSYFGDGMTDQTRTTW